MESKYKKIPKMIEDRRLVKNGDIYAMDLAHFLFKLDRGVFKRKGKSSSCKQNISLHWRMIRDVNPAYPLI